MVNVVSQVLLGECPVDDWLQLVGSEPHLEVGLLECCDVVWQGSGWKSGLEDNMQSGLKRVQESCGCASTLSRPDLPWF